MNITKIIRTSSNGAPLLRSSLPILSTYSTSASERIEIPKRIQRGPTDILRALEATVGRDHTAPHYKYHDDPYLIPMSNVGKRTFALAQEAGRKAAHWVRAQHPDLFQHKEMEPPIDAFIPPITYHENSHVSVADLQKLIDTAQVNDAKVVYKILRDKGEVGDDIRQAMLELACFQNGEDGISPEFVEERWFRQSLNAKEKQRKTWKDGDFAEELFIAMEAPSAEAYCALIQGMVKYHQVERAWQLYEEAQHKNIALNTNAYNALIQAVNYVKEDAFMRWELITNLLVRMKQAKLQPNLGTLNAVLQSLSTIGIGKVSQPNCLKVLAEFKQLGIEPSLASWYFVLVAFCKERGPVSTILVDIMNEIENKEHKIHTIKDTNFFVHAMEICRHHLGDVELAERVNKLLHFGNNYDLIGDSYKESVYFRNYFALLCEFLPFDEFMDATYARLVPHIYVPEPGVMETVLKTADSSGAIDYLPKLWSDMIVFDHSDREKLIEILVNSMVNNTPPKDSDLHAKFANVAWDISNRINTRNETKSNKIIFTGELVGKLMYLVLKDNQFEKGCQFMETLDKNQQTIVGVPRFDALELFVDHCIENKSPTRAINCIQYCADAGFPEVDALARKLVEQLNLDGEYLSKLTKIVGNMSLPQKDDAV